jgi:ABC-2 type transport system permease protein
MYIKELWNLPIASIPISFVAYFIGGFLQPLCRKQLVPLLIINRFTTISLPIIMPLMLSVYVDFFSVMTCMEP